MSDFNTKFKGGYINKSIEYEIWLTTDAKEVYIRYLKDTNFIDIREITISCSNFIRVLSLIEKEWRILCSHNDLYPLYEFEVIEDGNRVSVLGFELYISNNIEEKDLILELGQGEFIDYENLDDKFKAYTKNFYFKESFYTMMHSLSRRV